MKIRRALRPVWVRLPPPAPPLLAAERGPVLQATTRRAVLHHQLSATESSLAPHMQHLQPIPFSLAQRYALGFHRPPMKLDIGPPSWREGNGRTRYAAVRWGGSRCLWWRPKSSAIRLTCSRPKRWHLLSFDVPEKEGATRWPGKKLPTSPRFTRGWPVSATNSCVWRPRLPGHRSCFGNERSNLCRQCNHISFLSSRG